MWFAKYPNFPKQKFNPQENVTEQCSLHLTIHPNSDVFSRTKNNVSLFCCICSFCVVFFFCVIGVYRIIFSISPVLGRLLSQFHYSKKWFCPTTNLIFVCSRFLCDLSKQFFHSPNKSNWRKKKTTRFGLPTIHWEAHRKTVNTMYRKINNVLTTYSDQFALRVCVCACVCVNLCMWFREGVCLIVLVTFALCAIQEYKWWVNWKLNGNIILSTFVVHTVYTHTHTHTFG